MTQNINPVLRIWMLLYFFTKSLIYIPYFFTKLWKFISPVKAGTPSFLLFLVVACRSDMLLLVDLICISFRKFLNHNLTDFPFKSIPIIHLRPLHTKVSIYRLYSTLVVFHYIYLYNIGIHLHRIWTRRSYNKKILLYM